MHIKAAADDTSTSRIIIIHHTGTKDSADITSNPSIIIIYQAARIQLSLYVQGEREEGKKG